MTTRPTEKKKKVIVFTTDGKERTLVWMKCALRSLMDFGGDHDLRIVICTDAPDAVNRSLSDGDYGHVEIADVRGLIKAVGLDKMCEGRVFNGREVVPMQPFRLALPLVKELEGVGRVVFMDCDVEVVDGRFFDIFGMDTDDVDCLCAPDCPWSNVTVQRNIADLKRSGVWTHIPERSRKRMDGGVYVSAGVMLIDLNRFRRAHPDCVGFLKMQVEACFSHSLRQFDQSVINCFWDVGVMSSRFNAWGKSADGSEYLRHYPGGDKFKDKAYPPIQFQLLRKDRNPDIVYTVGKPSEHDDQEIRWSLRSIAKYGRNYGRIIVTSPVERTWLSNDVIQVDSQDIANAGYKHHNILKSILDTIDVLDMHETFFVSSDDHFYVKEVDFSNQPLVAQHWAIPQNMGASNNVHTMLWKTSCTDTREFLYRHGMPIIDFQMHRNSKWHGGLVRENKALFHEAMRWRFCVEPHVLMQNLWVHTQPNARVEFRKDAKIKEFHGIENGCDCISCYDQTFEDKAFMEFMNREFGEKCRFER